MYRIYFQYLDTNIGLNTWNIGICIINLIVLYTSDF